MGFFTKYNKLITDLEDNIKLVKGECGAIDHNLSKAQDNIKELISFVNEDKYVEAHKLYRKIKRNINAASNSVRRACNQPREWELLKLLKKFEISINAEHKPIIKQQRVQIHLGFATLQTYVSKIDNELAKELKQIMAIIESAKQPLNDKQKTNLINKISLLKNHIDGTIGFGPDHVGALQVIIALNEIEKVLKKEKNSPQFKA
jgi:hypothetical protein